MYSSQKNQPSFSDDSEWLVFVVVDVIEMTDGCNLAMLMHANTNIIENYNHQK